MLNGKFYTGLPPKMIERPTDRNHQKTNFFWPDESDVESVSESRNNKKKITARQSSQETQEIDIQPKVLFHKQLSSKIEFYDEPEKEYYSKQNNRMKSSNSIQSNNLNNCKDEIDFKAKKFETFSKSKIQFYDFEDEVPLKRNEDKPMNKTKPISNQKYTEPEELRDRKILKKPQEKKPIPSGKRITFEEKTKDQKNNNRNFNKPIGLVGKKKILSKSFDNLPRKFNFEDEDDSPEEHLANNIKNLKVHSEGKNSAVYGNKYDNNGDDYDDRNNQHKRREENCKKFENNDEDLRKSPKYGIAKPLILDTKRSNYSRNYSEKTNQYDSGEDDETYFKGNKKNSNRIDYNRYNGHYMDETKNSRNSMKYETNRNNNDNELDSIDNKDVYLANNNTNNKNNRYKYNVDENINENTRKNNNKKVTSAPTQNLMNKDINKVKQHLRSNIFFGDETNANGGNSERRTIRSSATNRVTVGLPTYY